MVSDVSRAFAEGLQKPERRQYERFGANASRVFGLLDLHTQLSRYDSPVSMDERSDILRSAVVLLHACLEDYLRTAAIAYFPLGEADAWDEIKLVGEKKGQLSLANLAKFRNESVESVLRKSIEEYWNLQSFGTIEKIKGLLNRLKIDSDFSELHPCMRELIERRHSIVHDADRSPIECDATGMVNRISVDQVTEWTKAVLEFIQRVHGELHFSWIKRREQQLS